MAITHREKQTIRLGAEVRRHSMLSPTAYSETAMPSLRLARSSRAAWVIAQVLFVGFLLTLMIVAIAPWQQSVTGSGNVIAFAPFERQQVLEAPTKGRISRWGEGIFENARVKKGQLIAELQDLDTGYIERLRDQLRNTEQSVEASKQQLDAYQNAMAAAQTVVTTYEAQIESYTKVQHETVAAADDYVEMAHRKVDAEHQQLEEYLAAISQLQLDYQRHKTLYEEGNIAGLKFQEVERKLREAEAKVARGKAYVAAAKEELSAKKREREAKLQKAQVDIEESYAKLRKAHSDVSKAQSEVAKAWSDFQKAEKELLEMQIKIARQQTQTVTAPFDGIIVSITPNQGTQVIKEGDAICTIVPDTKDRAVQIWLYGNDAPLVQTGRHVRLQFEGWPAIQFSGWPSVAVGTFGGTVVSVDAIDDGKGKFRALIRPDPESPAWPNDRFLRQGVRANAWVLLDTVPLWFEVWRNLNAFPPVVDVNEGQDNDGKKAKPPKLPK
ncbi:HlyD family secretion protein [Planctomicrobium sp. SH661]|uniref:HlyD family secretion protein n=1 Tax=Planctomicrobium sp. SH661 TaxID=3448124 RepID=UPI003F5B0CD4